MIECRKHKEIQNTKKQDTKYRKQNEVKWVIKPSGLYASLWEGVSWHSQRIPPSQGDWGLPWWQWWWLWWWWLWHLQLFGARERTLFINNQLSKFVGQTFQEVSERGGGLIVTHYFNIRSKLPQHHNYTEGNASNKQTNATNQSNNYHTLKRDQVLLGRELESVKCIWLIMHLQYVWRGRRGLPVRFIFNSFLSAAAVVVGGCKFK